MIIVNDSPSDVGYTAFASSINDPRIHYHVNDTNRGVNYTRNRALDMMSSDSEWVIFLDDDDYFAPDTLETFHDLIKDNTHKNWFVTNRAEKNGKPFTHFGKSNTVHGYAWEYLIRKTCKGDATHCIKTDLIHTIRFSNSVRQGEEWFFFYQVGLRSQMYYHDHNSTISGGYSATGLNVRTRTREEQLETVAKLLGEGAQLKLLIHPTFLLYILMRTLRAFIRHD
jgi:glycosyltransferase involved in cell wall biosynthesis